MKQIVFACMLLFCAASLRAQHNLQLIIKNKEDKTVLAGATVTIKSLLKTAVADSNGLVLFTGLPAGSYTISISFTGMEETAIQVSLPQPGNQPAEIFLNPAEEEGEEVVVTATRTSRTISNIPTRVETISGEELAEKGNMKPGDIRMMLNESTGIQTQQTSATSYNSGIRIQALDGRYTQLLRDGLPLYAGFSGGLSLMQVAPLDLKQVEVIKGSSSTLYGGGAIAGLVNLVSKTPGAERELNFIANGTSAKGLDLSGFYSERSRKLGVTIFGSANFGSAYDPAGNGFTAIPSFSRYTINPKLFVYGAKTNMIIGAGFISEERTGGSMDYIKHRQPGYFENNSTSRITTQLDIEHQLGAATKLRFKNSYAAFQRQVSIPAYTFEGLQQSSFSELSLNTLKGNSQWIAGVNFITDDFDEKEQPAGLSRDYHYNTAGAFIQNTWSPIGNFSMETGLRADYVKQYGFVLLPRLSAMYKFSHRFTARLGGGLGYKTPSVFNEESEKIQFRSILPVNEQTTVNERSAGGNFDLNYSTVIGHVRFSVNQLFFYTRLNKPLVMVNAAGGNTAFVNAAGYTAAKGMETNLRFIYHHFKLFVGYTYADANTNFNGAENWLPLTARHRLNNVLMYEEEDKLKIGLEAYYFSPQKLNDGTRGRSYWICGMMAEKLWERFSLFVNFENLFDTRQTRFGSIYSGSTSMPLFKDIYAPLDGFVVNGGIKIKV